MAAIFFWNHSQGGKLSKSNYHQESGKLFSFHLDLTTKSENLRGHWAIIQGYKDKLITR